LSSVRHGARPKAVVEPGFVYHALNRGNGRRTLFYKPADYQAFERVLAEVPMHLLAYCLMPNHWHLLLGPDAGQSAYTDLVYQPTLEVLALRDGKPVQRLLPEVDFMDNGPGKPIGIHRLIGRRPVMAFGNSDGDFEPLQRTTAGKGPRFGLIVHPTDARREGADDRQSPIGRLDHALDAAPKKGWAVRDMKKDWKVIDPFEK
jgi:hypothetical protein